MQAEGAGGEEPRRLGESGGGDPGDLLHPGGRVLGRDGGQLVEAHRPGVDELPVVEAFSDHDVHQAQRQGGVGAGAHLQVDVGARRRAR